MNEARVLVRQIYGDPRQSIDALSVFEVSEVHRILIQLVLDGVPDRVRRPTINNVCSVPTNRILLISSNIRLIRKVGKLLTVGGSC